MAAGRRIGAAASGGGGAAPDALAASVPVAVDPVRSVLAAVAVGCAIAVPACRAHGGPCGSPGSARLVRSDEIIVNRDDFLEPIVVIVKLVICIPPKQFDARKPDGKEFYGFESLGRHMIILRFPPQIHAHHFQ